MKFENSEKEFRRACKSLVGGVNSPVRAFRSVGATPIYIDCAYGSKIRDIDGNEFVEYVGSWGPMILGHAHHRVVEAIKRAASRGTSYGAPTVAETEMAELIKSIVPSVEIVRMVNSGTEATMSALRLARGYTGRDLIVKFEGCYHGHADSFLIKAGSGAMTLGLPDSPGVTAGTAKDTLTVGYNDIEAIKTLFAEKGDKIAGVIVEPVVGNMGVVIPAVGFLEALRDLTLRYGAVLIFDEVMTGFRVSRGGAQQLFGIAPDITTFGKIIGGGLPVGAYGGRAEIMSMVAPVGPIYQAGTLSGNPLAMAAGLETLRIIEENTDFYTRLESASAKLEAGIRLNLEKTGVKAIFNRVGSMFTLFFNDGKAVTNYMEAAQSDTKKYSQYFKKSLDNGIYLAPSQFEAAFVSFAHTDEDIEKTIAANLKALSELA